MFMHYRGNTEYYCEDCGFDKSQCQRCEFWFCFSCDGVMVEYGLCDDCYLDQERKDDLNKVRYASYDQWE